MKGLTDVRMTAVPPNPDAAGQAEVDRGPAFAYDSEALWEWAKSRTGKLREEGEYRAGVLRQVVALTAHGETLQAACQSVSRAEQVSLGTLKRWYYQARNYQSQDWAAALIPGYVGRVVRQEIPSPAWDWFTSYYLTRAKPTLTEAYRRTAETAVARGWGEIPSRRTFANRLKTDVTYTRQVFLREGGEALARLYPSQRRDKRSFRAGDAVSGDGLKFDRLWVIWPDGEAINTATGWFWADIRTGYIAAWRLAKTETTDLFRLATYDLTGLFKPQLAWVDNTMVAASKAMTAGAANRRRGRDKADDPVGLLPQLGIEVRFTNPDKEMGSPGAKPIERSFGIGGIHDKVATHPRFLKRGYSRATAIPYEEFAEVVRGEVTRFNQQPKRRTAACRGVLSYEQAFRELFAKAIPTKLTESQRALLLLMPEAVRAHSKSGEIRLKAGQGPTGQRRYWTEALTEFKGRQLTAYYDPADLTRPISVYTPQGRYVAQAELLADTGFGDTAAAREWMKNKGRMIKAQKKAANAERRMRDLEVAAAYPEAEPGPLPAPGLVAGNFGQKRQVDEKRRVVGGDSPTEDDVGLSPVDRFVLENLEDWKKEKFG
ncbi:MAG: Mu transposase C-terminal domain-containing protein [Acidobacteriota bacterium]|nr:Mu transposase C-terminal domain-containing protein [Acidobacteriota bacterium]